MFNNLRGLAQKSKILLMVLAILLFLVNIAVFLPEEKTARINAHDLMGEFDTSNNQSFPETKNITLNQGPEAVSQVSSPEDYGNSVLTTFGFEKYPFLPSNQTVSCIPYSFGYSDEQARRFFDPNKKFGSCKANNEQFLFYTDNNLEINNCQGSKDYALGTVPGQEELGAVSYKINWIPYKQPVDTGSSEFFYGKCGNKKQTFLINKRKEDAKKLVQETKLYPELTQVSFSQTTEKDKKSATYTEKFNVRDKVKRTLSPGLPNQKLSFLSPKHQEICSNLKNYISKYDKKLLSAQQTKETPHKPISLKKRIGGGFVRNKN